MAWRNFLAVIVIFFAGCAADIPIDFYISTAWLKYPDEVRAVKEGADAWNEATCLEIFRFQGYFDDEVFDTENLQVDTPLVVYPVWQDESEVAEKIARYGDFAGYSINDIIIKRFSVFNITAFRWHNVYYYPEKNVPPRDYFLKVLKGVLTHEFGHQIIRPAFGHNSADRGLSVMNPNIESFWWSYAPTRLDVDQVCEFHNCPANCPTRPAF